jgi:hypothetical protein
VLTSVTVDGVTQRAAHRWPEAARRCAGEGRLVGWDVGVDDGAPSPATPVPRAPMRPDQSRFESQLPLSSPFRLPPNS